MDAALGVGFVESEADGVGAVDALNGGNARQVGDGADQDFGVGDALHRRGRHRWRGQRDEPSGGNDHGARHCHRWACGRHGLWIAGHATCHFGRSLVAARSRPAVISFDAGWMTAWFALPDPGSRTHTSESYGNPKATVSTRRGHAFRPRFCARPRTSDPVCLPDGDTDSRNARPTWFSLSLGMSPPSQSRAFPVGNRRCADRFRRRRCCIRREPRPRPVRFSDRRSEPATRRPEGCRC